MPTATDRSPLRILGWAVALGLGILCWLSRTAPPFLSATAELDPSYQQGLGVALTRGMAFGRDVVFTNGPLAYFIASPFDPALYEVKFWLWELVFRGAISLALFARLSRRGTWLDFALGALTLIVLHLSEDAWLFAAAFLAADLGLETFASSAPARARRLRAVAEVAAMLVFAILALVKVTSMTAAFACVGVLTLHAWRNEGWKAALRSVGIYAVLQCLLWVAIGQDLRDLPAYFGTSIELASGFDAAMSQPPTPENLVIGVGALALLLLLCAWHARPLRAEARRWAFDRRRAQTLIAAGLVLLAFKGSFARAFDHLPTFFGTASLAPLFLIPFERAAKSPPLVRGALLRGAAIAILSVCAVLGFRGGAPPLRAIAQNALRRIQSSAAWYADPQAKLAELQRARQHLVRRSALPRLAAIIGEQGVCNFDHAQGIVFLNELNWKPRPVFQSFSVFTQRSAERNAQFLESDDGPPFVLWRGANIDRRLAASEDPLAVQALLRSYRLRAYESGFLLMERAPPRTTEPRSSIQRGTLGWNETLEVPRTDAPLVLKARIEPSLSGRLRALFYQTPEIYVNLGFPDGSTVNNRVVPFALEAGVVLDPWLPDEHLWIVHGLRKHPRTITRLSFESAGQGAFAPRIEYEFERAPDLAARVLDEEIERELVLGAAGDLPVSYDSYKEPQTVIWPSHGLMLLAYAPARMVFAAPAGRVRFSAELYVPPWISDAPEFTGVRVRVLARDGGEARQCQMMVLQRGAPGEFEVHGELRVDERFAQDGELVLILSPAPGCAPTLAKVAIDSLRVRSIPD